ncbi:ubiquitin-like protein ISG15 isoform X1 [Notolabrus celidotus]|uniref:ubiquitin-like protein ISG15 isoform X1 n=1 Tax=Notolabrus celidotus TaxID=1203425 RepID=UPI00148F7642|nr:ubiquitin-like protein ISG15 isoform X1 [Notolabrus celidotus]
MELTIVMLGESHSLCVNPDDTVGSLKRLIQEKLNVPYQDQRLVFDNGHRTPLSDDSRTLRSYSLQSGSRVTLLVTQPPATQPPATFQVFLKNEKNKTTTYDITKDETVDEFKTKVQKREGVAVSQMRLVFQGRDMTQGKLSDYHVKEHSTIEMTMRLRGG